jgi:hypothetical protein
MTTTRRIATLTIAALLALPGIAAASQLLRLNGIGPLKLGMKRADALSTGWLAHKTKGCELSTPRPIAYSLTGPSAPAGVKGTIEFQSGKLIAMSFTKGVHTAAGVNVGQTTSAQMIGDYTGGGFSASAAVSTMFGGTFTTVKHSGHVVLQGFGPKKIVTQLAIPAVQVCD